jgi:hypothetical protein
MRLESEPCEKGFRFKTVRIDEMKEKRGLTVLHPQPSKSMRLKSGLIRKHTVKHTVMRRISMKL